GWLTDNAGLEVTHDTGRTWQLIPGAPRLDSADRVTPNFGVGWSAHNRRIWLWRTADGGRHWTPMPLPRALRDDADNPQDPVCAWFVSPTVGWLLADGATWRTSDGGRTWLRGVG